MLLSLFPIVMILVIAVGFIAGVVVGINQEIQRRKAAAEAAREDEEV